MNAAPGKIIYFVRHAKDDSRYRGGWSRRPLVREGDIQARELAEKIGGSIDTLTINTIISSDLPRALQTAKPCSQILDIPIITSMGWRETNNGKLAGMLNREAERRYPGMYWSALEPDQRYPGGESPSEFYCRIKREFELLKADVIEEKLRSNVIVFTHSGVINILYSIICDELWTNKNRSFDIPYTSVHAYDMSCEKIQRIL